MKRAISWAGALALGCGLTGLMAWAEAPQGGLPAPFPETRYEQMRVRSPFSVASASAAATAAPTPGFAAQLYIEGVATDGPKEFVAIKSRALDDKSNVMYLEVGGTSDDGMKVESMQYSAEMGKSTVTVSKGGERATLHFDEDQIAKGGDAGGGAPGIRLPVMPGGRPIGYMQNGGYPQAAGYPRVRVMGQPNGPAYPPSPAGINMRRRIQTIQSGQ